MRKTIIILLSTLALLFLLLIVVNTTSNNKNNVKFDRDQVVTDAKTTREKISKENNPIATIVLNDGKEDYSFTFELFPDQAPQSVYNFISLANKKFYDGLTIHRLIKDFVMQGGDPEGNGSGGPGYAIKGEFPSNGVSTGLTHQIGALAWARSQALDSAGSQFYIVLNDGVQSLDSNYAVFGYMIDGFDNLEYFNNYKTAVGDVPVNPIEIKSVSVDTKGIKYPEPEKNEDISTIQD